MTGALIIFVGMVAIGIVLYLLDGRHPAQDKAGESAAVDNADMAVNDAPSGEGGEESADAGGEVCCGLHLVCEKTSLSPMSGEVVYYDDEELDRFRGRTADGYTPEETEEFRDVLLTLLPQDVAGWSRSIQVRGITLPSEIRDELLMIVAEQRAHE